MKSHPEDTIVAISTPPGRGAIGIVRVSGTRALEIAGRIGRSPGGDGLAPGASHTLRRAVIMKDGDAVDDALVAVMRRPRSYTGEDMAEFHCHGNPLVLARVVEECLREGARPALPGEFTRRAFLNGKIGLDQAEAVAELIEASSERALELAVRQAGGELGRRVRELRSLLTDVCAGVEARLEFPDEDLDGAEGKELLASLARAAEACRELTAAHERGTRVREGLRAVIVGKPNAGKSSIFNRLLRDERALVTAQKGTTRDTIEETITLEGMAVTLVDTAGISGEHRDEAGKAAVARSLNAMETGDLLLFVADGSEPWSGEDREIAVRTRGKTGVVILNKADLQRRIDPLRPPEEIAEWQTISASALSPRGVDSIISYMINYIYGYCEHFASDSFVVCSIRQSDALRRCLDGIKAALELAGNGDCDELVSVEVRKSIEALGEITGESVENDVLDRIFSKFCIGK